MPIVGLLAEFLFVTGTMAGITAKGLWKPTAVYSVRSLTTIEAAKLFGPESWSTMSMVISWWLNSGTGCIAVLLEFCPEGS